MSEDAKELIDRIDDLGKQVTGLKISGASTIAPFVTAIVTLLIALLSWWNNRAIEMNNRNIENLQKVVEIQHAHISDRQGEAAMGTNLYKEVFLVVGEQNVKKKKAVLDLLHAVEAGYRDDEEKQSMREYMKQLEALFEDSDEKGIKATASFYMDDAAIAFRSVAELPRAAVGPDKQAPAQKPTSSGTLVSPGAQGGWDYDVFWCEGDSRNQKLATTIFQGLRDQQVKEKLGRLRLRMLPTTIKESSGYEIGNRVVIRRHFSKDEQSQILRKTILEILKTEPTPISIDIDDSAQRLPWYLSVFVCPN